MATTIEHDGPVPVHRQLADILRDQILSGHIEPDCALPSEADIRQRYGVLPEDVRRAIQELSDEGLVYILADQGAYVSSRAEETGGG
ncbi:GntR family transcriptional regulator [Microtetraspora sp. AC03309]|uniref:winged helix-turn-helix domain-containing protein n=1 Tax=Microtetraspora sp. AC03309 TaxID=2779376 RepID=UPI001E41C692|nr:GntR family transcriptional regulator [Microtetraspora sp. AC03309]MCC5581268.1 GntR family transcriptional regulator [Microtetraspora sp. AC03309]